MIYNFFEYESGTPDDDESTTAVNESDVSKTPDRGWVEVTGSGSLFFNGRFATSSGEGVLPNVTGISTDDGNITLDATIGSSRGLWDLGLISAKGNERIDNKAMDFGIAGASVIWTAGIVVANNFEGIWADYNIMVAGAIAVTGDIDSFHAGNDFMNTGMIEAGNINKIKAGGNIMISAGGITLTDSDSGSIGPITAGGDVQIDAPIVAKNVGLISATAGDFSILTGGLLTLSGDLAGINASNDINIFVGHGGRHVDVAVIAAEGSVGDLTAGGNIHIQNDITANGIGNISAGERSQLAAQCNRLFD